jgi:hypothetical protein
MTFEQAYLHLKEGQPVCRLDWAGRSRIVKCGHKISLHSRIGVTDWSPYVLDFEATDWAVYTEDTVFEDEVPDLVPHETKG